MTTFPPRSTSASLSSVMASSRLRTAATDAGESAPLVGGAGEPDRLLVAGSDAGESFSFGPAMSEAGEPAQLRSAVGDARGPASLPTPASDAGDPAADPAPRCPDVVDAGEPAALREAAPSDATFLWLRMMTFPLRRTSVLLSSVVESGWTTAQGGDPGEPASLRAEGNDAGEPARLLVAVSAAGDAASLSALVSDAGDPPSLRLEVNDAGEPASLCGAAENDPTWRWLRTTSLR